MWLIGIGIDFVDLPSFETLYGSSETDLTRIFTSDELSYAGHGRERFLRLAARFAAKEAALKALGCGLQDGISLVDISVEILTSGAPQLTISGGALQEADRLGVSRWLVSLTHLEAAAGAVVVALSALPK